MTQLREIKPSQSQRIMDLVSDAGVDVSDWVKFRAGPKPERSASNPKYCYEWAFIESGKVVVLNLWHKHMQERNGAIVHEGNIRRYGDDMGALGRHIFSMRATRLDSALQAAVRDRLPIRVIILDGDTREPDDPKSKVSRVRNRLLDSEPWAVTAYDWVTGECTITRGAKPDRFVDQFDISETQSESEKRWSSGENYVRAPEVRRQALERAGGKCEYCDQSGFVMSDGRIFLESHHVIPLSEGGADSVLNVAALCPNHHREAHYGGIRTNIRQALLQKLKS